MPYLAGIIGLIALWLPAMRSPQTFRRAGSLMMTMETQIMPRFNS